MKEAGRALGTAVAKDKMTPLSPLDALNAFRDMLPARPRLYVAGCSGEPLAIVEAFRSTPDLADGVTFFGIWIPGVNQTDWAGLHPGARAESIFIGPNLRDSFVEGHTDFLPLSYTQSWEWLSSTPADGAIVMVSAPDAQGQVSLGVSADFSPALLERHDVPALALINPALPAPVDGPRVDLDRFTIIAQADTPLIQVPSASLPDTFRHIGSHIANLVSPGDTLQFGLGNVQQAVLIALHTHRDLRIHSGMISDPLLGLLDSGAVSSCRESIVTGVAIGTDPLYARVSADPRFSFRTVAHTHALSTLAGLRGLKAINSAIEVDLFGQANAEFIAGRQVSGTGGLVDFMRGAAAASQGRAITALASTAKGGSLSRIVPRLAPDATSIARADMDTVVTEHGVAELKNRSIDQRAAALIEIAAPQFRDQLANDWDAMRRAM